MREHEVLSNGVVFSACSAFEFGGDVHHERSRGGSGSSNNSSSSSIVVFKYPLKDPHKYTARPFESAVVRLTRESLSVYRPTDRVFFCELNWCDVREIRRHTSKRRNQMSYEFAFFTHAAGIILLETYDIRIIDGIAVSLQLLSVGCVLQSSNSQTTTTPIVASTGVTGRVSRRETSPSTTPLTQVAPRDDAISQALRRIREREEEMREAIFYGPPIQSPATNSHPHLHSSSPPRSESYPREDMRPPRRDVELTAAGMHNLLMLLEEEEKKATKSLRTQEERIRTLCSREETKFPERLWQHKVSTPNDDLMHHNRPAVVVSESREVYEQTNMMRGMLNERHNLKTQPMMSPKSEMDSTRPTQSYDEPQEVDQKIGHEPIPHNVISGDVTTHGVRDEKERAILPLLNSLDEDTKRNKDLNEGRRLELHHKVMENQQPISVAGGFSLTEALERERQTEELTRQNDMKKSESITEGDHVNSGAVTLSSAEENREPKTGGVLYGNWKEFRDKESGKVYYRNIVTKEAQWKPPPEVLEMKQREKKTFSEEPESTKTKKGPLRILGVWKEYKDPKSDRLYYVNGETKQRTWKVEETPFRGE
ncbi:uncharacterized protein TM35_000232590 [Trypanosoma theileri]|uniref:WW domain-containing protein n=1 Tax=Trypanosoma theileri TaxID=67003 RepID=A0A1X0NRW7_9TRYP|nr:uncharacterized protein TM35_000232590 [Trypanosoma theileri]ORC87288.1 hypothetical protein TM35_000232590 [Trypanosoma theileri]